MESSVRLRLRFVGEEQRWRPVDCDFACRLISNRETPRGELEHDAKDEFDCRCGRDWTDHGGHVNVRQPSKASAPWSQGIRTYRPRLRNGASETDSQRRRSKRVGTQHSLAAMGQEGRIWHRARPPVQTLWGLLPKARQSSPPCPKPGVLREQQLARLHPPQSTHPEKARRSVYPLV